MMSDNMLGAINLRIIIYQFVCTYMPYGILHFF
jgi:hypothetical protein